jgi:glycerol-3-phosphate dehydrogenase
LDQWTEPARAPKVWLKDHAPEDLLLCECEMVPGSAVDVIVDSIHKQGDRADLQEIGLRTRIGKGPCQGTFCGPRLTAYLFDQGELEAGQGLHGLREFVRSRWKGLHPILWDRQLQQAELSEAMHCGILGLEMEGQG